MDARRGFTLIELLIFTAIFALVMSGIVTMLVTVTTVRSSQMTAFDVETQAQSMIQLINNAISSATYVVSPANDATSSQLNYRIRSATPYITGTGGVLVIGGSGGNIIGNAMISNLQFEPHFNKGSASNPYGTQTVSYSFTLTENASNTLKAYSKNFQSSAILSMPVPKIVLANQSGGSLQGLRSNIGISAGWTGVLNDLMIAVISNTGTSTDGITVGDGYNTWTKVADVVSASNTQRMAIFYAVAATSTQPSVNATFTTSVADPYIGVFDYRGVATSSPFDASSTQAQSNALTWSTGTASPAAGIELLFGMLYLDSIPAAGVTAGPGFIVEASSNVSNVFIEDQTSYVTTPMSASWSSSGAASSSAVLVTFKAGS